MKRRWQCVRPRRPRVSVRPIGVEALTVPSADGAISIGERANGAMVIGVGAPLRGQRRVLNQNEPVPSLTMLNTSDFDDGDHWKRDRVG